jgi:C-terminal processing protease CtpA/Prc
MKLKNRYWLIVAALVIPITFAGAHPGQRLQGERADDSPTRQRIADDFTKAILVAKDNYAGQIDLNKATKASILGMLHTLDPHSNYFDPKEWRRFSRTTQPLFGHRLDHRSTKRQGLHNVPLRCDAGPSRRDPLW